MSEYTLVNPVTKTIWDFETGHTLEGTDHIHVVINDKANGIYNMHISVNIDDGLVAWGKLRRLGWISLHDDLKEAV
jgi:hypothetical protein